MQGGPVLVALVSFSVYGLTESSRLTADQAFTALTLFNLFGMSLMMFPRVLVLIFQAKVSSERIQEFLLMDEIINEITAIETPQEFAIKIEHAIFDLPSSSSNDEEKKDLSPSSTQSHEINLQIPRGHLVLIVGSVGSGKSTLLNAILGEFKLKSGKVYKNTASTSSIAYISQTPWILNNTIKQNIVFGEAYDVMKLQHVLEVCALMADLKMFPAGIETEIGERGVTLSGGQKQRISIARALYADRDTYLFDDCLSALDAHVGQLIFQNCILKALAQKTRIFVTHAVQYCPQAHSVVVMEDHAIVEQGTVKELLSSPSAFSKLYGSVSENETVIRDFQEQAPIEEASSETKKNVLSSSVEVNITIDDQTRATSTGLTTLMKSRTSKQTSDRGTLVEAEERETGAVSSQTYWSYIRSSGGFSRIFTIVLFAMSCQVMSIVQDLWLTHWTESIDSTTRIGYYMKIYAVLASSVVLCIFTSDVVAKIATLVAARAIHAQLLNRIIRAPVQFFDTTPVGRIINRFSNDVLVIDQKLGTSLLMGLTIGLRVSSRMLVQVILSSSYILVAVIVPVFIIYRTMQQYYRRSTRELQRLDSVTKSPIFAHIGQTLSGLATVRAYDVEWKFIDENERRIDANTRAFLLLNLVNRWLGVRLEFLGTIVTVAVAILVIPSTSSDSGTVSREAAARGGLILSYSQSITFLLNWLVRTNIQTENMMNSIERMNEYSNLPCEEEEGADVLDLAPPDTWPSSGQIEFQNVSARYRPELDLVLKNISFTISAGAKVGICGRTGSGKSTLLLVLYRMVSWSSFDMAGKILIRINRLFRSTLVRVRL